MIRPKLEYYCDKKRHLVCKPYSVENLHIMAMLLSVNKCNYHGGDKPHYDIPRTFYSRVSKECKIVSEREILQIIQEGLGKDVQGVLF